METVKKYTVKIDGHYIVDLTPKGAQCTDKLKHALMLDSDERAAMLKVLANVVKPEYLDKIETELYEITIQESNDSGVYVLKLIDDLDTGDFSYFISDSKTSVQSNKKFYRAKQMNHAVASAYKVIVENEITETGLDVKKVEMCQVDIKYNLLKTL